MNLANALRKIQPNRVDFLHRTAPILAVHKATALWHIAMPVAGAVHCIKSGNRHRMIIGAFFFQKRYGNGVGYAILVMAARPPGFSGTSGSVELVELGHVDRRIEWRLTSSRRARRRSDG